MSEDEMIEDNETMEGGPEMRSAEEHIAEMPEGPEKDAAIEALKDISEDAETAAPVIVYSDIMIDIETMGKAANAAIIAIGAVEFDPMTGETGEEFEYHIDWEDAFSKGAVDIDTIKWWMGQSDEARTYAIQDGFPLQTVLLLLAEFIKAANGNDVVTVWSNGSIFDLKILEVTYANLGVEAPWGFRAVNDCRTVERLVEGFVTRDNIDRDGLHHGALDDAKYQVKYISEMYAAIRDGLFETREYTDENCICGLRCSDGEVCVCAEPEEDLPLSPCGQEQCPDHVECTGTGGRTDSCLGD